MGYINVEKGTVSQSIVFQPNFGVCVFCVLLYLIFFLFQFVAHFLCVSHFLSCSILPNSASIFLTSFRCPFGISWIYIFYFVLHFYFNVTISQFCGYVYVVSVHMYKFHSQSVNGSEYENRFPWHRIYTHTKHWLHVWLVQPYNVNIVIITSKSKTDRFSILTSCNNRTTCFWIWFEIGALISNAQSISIKFDDFVRRKP